MSNGLDSGVVYKEVRVFDTQFEGYLAGADGSVWSCFKKGPGSPMTDTWHKLKQSWGGRKVGSVGKMGVELADNLYLQVSVCKDGKRKTVPVHRIILETFVGPKPEGMVGRHFPDCDKSNCRADNLVWGTYAENCDDRRRDGNSQHGEKNVNAKITADDVRTIRADVRYGAVTRNSKRFGLSATTVIAIRKRRTWKHVVP